MENNDAKIVAISLGIPSATFLIAALIIAFRSLLPPPLPTVPIASCSSSSHPESSHPYRDTRSQSTTLLGLTIKKRSWMSQLIQREGLLPLLEGVCQSSSPPPTLPLPSIPHMSLELPHLAHTPDSLSMSGDSTWAETLDPSAQSPITTSGLTGTILHHPMLVSLPGSSGTMSPFHGAPTSLPRAMDPPITEPLPQLATPAIPSGTSLYRTRSSHPSLYESRHQSRHPSPVHWPTSTPHHEAASCWEQLTQRLRDQQQHEDPQPSEPQQFGNWPLDPSSDSSMAVDPP
ncbi:hypothetical protein ARMGADRAFT_1090138 [Armillaria gallica]|uniref:Uncharacterized protein n=1 Tax=Armillaria gallica TaxID=47427 RepID=A0A2H3D2Z0_ARMGA|nr:hypothetical protein ARMGADRAFT_1090138 [Armillaria gallica]